jgi:hypothetical protein
MIELGDEVKDEVTGFQGIAVARTEWLHGCKRIVIQPPLGKDEELKDSATFDEPQLVVIKSKKVKNHLDTLEAKQAKRTYGDRDYKEVR